jgi:hypothetical protein
MGGRSRQDRDTAAWALARRQHGAISRAQLLRLGFSRKAIEHRLAVGKLFPVFRGVYAVGRRELTQEGWFSCAVLACGEDIAAISHESAVTLYGVGRRSLRHPLHVSVPAGASRVSRPGIEVHRRESLEVVTRRGIRVTTPECTIVDMAAIWDRDDVEAMINEAVIRRLTSVAKIREALDGWGSRAGKAPLRRIIDVRTFRFTRSQLERAFIPIALRAGLPLPLTCHVVNGFEVDFYWPELGLVVEADGLSFHRTPQQQAEDLRRDQAHVAAGLTCCRFSHGQIRYEPLEVEKVLRSIADRLLLAAL